LLSHVDAWLDSDGIVAHMCIGMMSISKVD